MIKIWTNKDRQKMWDEQTINDMKYGTDFMKGDMTLEHMDFLLECRYSNQLKGIPFTTDQKFLIQSLFCMKKYSCIDRKNPVDLLDKIHYGMNVIPKTNLLFWDNYEDILGLLIINYNKKRS